jgi:hypothetical protein
MSDTASFTSKVCDKHSNRLCISGKEIIEALGDCDMMLACTTDRFMAAAPLNMSADMNSQKDRLCRFYGINQNDAQLHTFKVDKKGRFYPAFVWLNNYLHADKNDLYVLSKPCGSTDKKFCIEVKALQCLVSERIKKIYDAVANHVSTMQPLVEHEQQ